MCSRDSIIDKPLFQTQRSASRMADFHRLVEDVRAAFDTGFNIYLLFAHFEPTKVDQRTSNGEFRS